MKAKRHVMGIPAMDVRIWGRIERIGPREFFVIASAVPNRFGGGETAVEISMKLAATLNEAQETLDDIIRELGRAMQVRGHRVVDVEME